jgi:hypothetical protein
LDSIADWLGGGYGDVAAFVETVRTMYQMLQWLITTGEPIFT